jgi:hypothetical protein
MKSILYVGMDVHKETIVIACGSEGKEIRVIGTIANAAAALDPDPSLERSSNDGH